MSSPVHTSYSRNPWTRALVNNSTATDFPGTGGPEATETEPVTIDESGDPSDNAWVGQTKGSHLVIQPFGTDGDNETFVIRIATWREADGLWTPTHLGDVTCTMCTKVGVAGATVINTERFCDGLAGTAYADDAAGTGRIQTFGPATVDATTGANLIGDITVRLDGAQKVGVYFDLGTGASGNFLYSFF